MAERVVGSRMRRSCYGLSMDGIPELSVAEVAAKLRQPGVFIFDANGQGRWRRSHVPGATNVNAYNFDASVLPADKSATLVFYCSGPG